MTRSRKIGSRGRRVALAGALAAVSAMAFGATSASAAPRDLNVTFDDAALYAAGRGNCGCLGILPNTSSDLPAPAIDTRHPAPSQALVLTFPQFPGYGQRRSL